MFNLKIMVDCKCREEDRTLLKRCTNGVFLEVNKHPKFRCCCTVALSCKQILLHGTRQATIMPFFWMLYWVCWYPVSGSQICISKHHITKIYEPDRSGKARKCIQILLEIFWLEKNSISKRIHWDIALIEFWDLNFLLS